MIDPQLLHEFFIASSHQNTVHQSGNAPAAVLLNICDPAAVRLLTTGHLQTFANGVGGCALGQCCIFQKLIFRHGAMIHTTYRKDTLS